MPSAARRSVDFAPVTRTANSPLALIVDSGAGAKTARDLFAQARANPGKLSFGTGTPTTRLSGELIKSMASADMLNVPFKSSAGTVQGLLSKDVDFILDGLTSALPYIRNGKFRILGTLSSDRIETLPGLPLLSSEAGLPPIEVSVWLGLVAPAGTPAEIISRLNQEVVHILGLPEVRERLANIGMIPVTSTPAEFSAFILAESNRWARVIKQSNIKIE